MRPLLLWLCAAKIALLILVFDPAGVVAFQLPKALASRALEWPIAGALAYAITTRGFAVLPRTRLHLVVLAVIAANLLSAPFAADRYLAVFGDPENYAGLTYLFDMATLYLALSVAVRTERDALTILGAIGLAGAIAVAYGAVQALGLDPFAWAVDPTSRPFSSFGNPDHFGHFLSVLFGIALGAAIAAGPARTRALAAMATLVTLATAAIVATRGTLLGIAAAFVAAPFVRRVSMRAFVAGIAAAILFGAALSLTPLGARVFTSSYGVADRLALFGIAASAAATRPVLGYGPDNFRVAFAQNRTAESIRVIGPGPQATAHDWILDAAATTGPIGLAAWLAFVVLGTLELRRLALARPQLGVPLALGWAAYWAHAFVAAVSLAAAWYPWVALGVAAALGGEHVAEVRPRAVPRWAVVLLALVAVIGAATGARAFQANRDAWSAEEAAHFGDLDAAVTFADRAAARDGGRADNWDRLGRALQAARRDRAAVDAFREATARAPYEAVYWANFGRGLARVAGTDQAMRNDAIAAARQATLVDPNAPVGHVALAEIASAFARCDLARSAAARAAALEPGHEELVRRAEACR